MKDAPLSNLFRHVIIKTKNKLMVFSDSSCQDCTDTDIITEACIILYQGLPIDYVTHITVPAAQSSTESE